jgi:hypothetical protein
MRESQEMVFDAHDKAFAFFRGTCTRGIYDNMKTAVEAVFVGKERLYNRRFLQMCSHYLVEPVACTPASGWEKGQVENQVGLVRERFFTPRLRVKSLRGIERLAARQMHQPTPRPTSHPSRPTTRSGRCSRPSAAASCGYVGPFDGFHCVPASVSKTCTVRFDNNKYSVLSTPSAARSSPCLCRPDRHQAGWRDHRRTSIAASAAARRSMIPGIMCRSWPASPALLRNGAPFREWVLPTAMEKVRKRLKTADDGDRQMVTILGCVPGDGIRRRGCLPGGARSRRLLGCGHPQHPGAASRSGSGRTFLQTPRCTAAHP